MYLEAIIAVGPEWVVGEVRVVGVDEVEGSDHGVGADEEPARPSRIWVNLSTSVISQHEESMGWSRFPLCATQT